MFPFGQLIINVYHYYLFQLPKINTILFTIVDYVGKEYTQVTK